jgi:hypothetical protein
MKIGTGALFRVFLLSAAALAAQSAHAFACMAKIPHYELVSETVYAEMTVASGQSCTHGLRGRTMTLDSVEVVTAPTHGGLILQGTGFVYRSNPDFKGEDLFAIAIHGKNLGVSGTSTVRVQVSVK